MKRAHLPGIAFLLSSLLLSASAEKVLILRYVSTTASVATNWTYKVAKNAGGKIAVEQASDRGEITRFENDAKANSLWYRTENKGKGFVFDCRISGKKLRTYRSEGGVTRDASFDLDAAPWYQDWGFCLQDWVLSAGKTTEFWTLNDDLTIYKFWVEKIGKERLKVPAGDFEVWRVRIKITGFLSIFWSGEMFFRASDGLFIKNDMALGQGAPNTVYELVSVAEE